ncbi:hypothetical protein H311_04539, partial [Anncaliia algerae PRA109]
SSFHREDEKLQVITTRLEKCKLLEHLEYVYEPGSTNVSIKKRIPYLENIRIQDVREWVSTVSEAVKETKWSIEDSVEIIQALIRIPYSKQKEKYSTPLEIFNDLYATYYPKEDTYLYLDKLKNIKQNSYYLIEEYVEAIDVQLLKLSTCLKLGKKEMQNKFEEIFISGLCIETRIEMINLKLLDDMQGIINHIKKIEKALKETTKRENSDKERDESKVEVLPEHSYKPYPKKQLYTKWCKNCRSNTHNTIYCFKSKSKNEITNKHKPSEETVEKDTFKRHNDKKRSYILRNSEN